MNRATIRARRVTIIGLIAACAACATAARAPTAPPNAPSGLSMAVEIENLSEPVLCAEKDNVSVAARGHNVHSFRIEVSHPVYTSMLRRDSKEADWTACDMRADPVHAPTSPPRKVVLYEDATIEVIGYTQPSFWRPTTASVRIGDRVEKSLHFLQVWLRTPERREEVLVLYPQDGYWRARPLAPPELPETAYGSSFLIGPIEHSERPIVQIREITFDPSARMFVLYFERGGTASLQMLRTDHDRHTLEVRFSKAIEGQPFAMLRSMYVTEFNNDVARIALREPNARGFREDNIMRFVRATATDVWMGRLTPSQHNTSSPDTLFHRFSSAPEPDFKHQPNHPPPTNTQAP